MPSLNVTNAAAYLNVVSSQLASLLAAYRDDSEHEKLAVAIDRAADRAIVRTSELV